MSTHSMLGQLIGELELIRMTLLTAFCVSLGLVFKLKSRRCVRLSNEMMVNLSKWCLNSGVVILVYKSMNMVNLNLNGIRSWYRLIKYGWFRNDLPRLTTGCSFVFRSGDGVIIGNKCTQKGCRRASFLCGCLVGVVHSMVKFKGTHYTIPGPHGVSLSEGGRPYTIFCTWCVRSHHCWGSYRLGDCPQQQPFRQTWKTMFRYSRNELLLLGVEVLVAFYAYLCVQK